MKSGTLWAALVEVLGIATFNTIGPYTNEEGHDVVSVINVVRAL